LDFNLKVARPLLKHHCKDLFCQLITRFTKKKVTKTVKGGAMEKKIKKIIVACDCSDYSTEIFAYAAEVARRLDAKVIVTNVINRSELDRTEWALAMYAPFSMEDYLAAQKDDRRKIIQELIEATGQETLFTKTILKVGVPFQELIGAIKEEEADLLIMGNKGRGNLANVLLGSCAEKMFRRCPVALLSVRVSKEKR
jgi:nucleotide-binding universal stress UspA family protein